MKVLLTGASGFVGNALCGQLVSQGTAVIGAVRHVPTQRIFGVEYRIVGDLGASTGNPP